MYAVELVGIPGAGKSTIARILARRIKQKFGCSCMASEDAFVHVLRRQGELLCRLALGLTVGKTARRMAQAYYRKSTCRLNRIVDFLLAQSSLIEHILTAKQFKEMSIEDQHYLMSGVLNGGAVYHTIKFLKDSDIIVLFDELFITWSLIMTSPRDLQADAEKSIAFVSKTPLPDLIINLKADADTCVSRMRQRPKGIPKRLRGLADSRLREALGLIDHNISFILDWISNNGGIAIQVQSRDTVQETVEAIINQMLPIMARSIGNGRIILND